MGRSTAHRPLLRIETGRHTAFIHALALDEASGKVYSASEDKTIRVWRIADGRLLDTFRVPAGFRAEGQLYALALSPDRRTLAAAGWTCWEAEQAACIYLLDADTGELRARIAGLEEVVAILALLAGRQVPGGRHDGYGGPRVYELKTRERVAADHEYRGKLLELDFSPHGELLTSSVDGFLRVYDRQFKLSGRVNAGLAGREPFGVRYSPDGRYVAVGFNDVARISILNASDLSVLRTLKLDGAASAAQSHASRVERELAGRGRHRRAHRAAECLRVPLGADASRPAAAAAAHARAHRRSRRARRR